MKTQIKLFAITVACYALLEANALAKKDKSEDAEKQKSSEKTYRNPQVSPGSSGYKAPTQTSQKPSYEKKPQQQIPKQDVKPRQPQTSRQEKKTGSQDIPKQPKKKEATTSGKAQSKESAPKKDVASGKSEDTSRKTVKPSSANKRNDKDVSSGREEKDPPSAKQKAMDLPGKRPKIADNPDKSDKSDKSVDNKKDGDKGHGKAMDLPGKKPDVPGADKRKDVDRPDLSKGDKKTEELAAKGKVRSESQKKAIVRPGQNTKQVRRPDLNQKDSKVWWNGNNKKSNNRDIHITNVNNVTKVNNNFQQNVNWSTRRHHWGYNPWWNRPAVRPWYGSSWSCGWNRNYYDNHYNYGYGHSYRLPGYYHNDAAEAIGWGLLGWSLGTMIYDTGYRSYYNPYPVKPVYINDTMAVNYAEPITQVAVRSAPEDDALVAQATTKSESLMGESQRAFKERNYLVALELADKAIAESPGDGALHEYRALVHFSLGKYGEAAGILNPVLASGPGWDWPTMIALFDAQQTYTDQLQRLEAYSEEKPDAADAHFLLGYHYMVCGHLDLATPQFELAQKLMPSDSVSRELAELTRSSKTPSDEPDAGEPVEPAESPRPAPVPLEKLTGVWVNTRDAGSSITLTFKGDGKFTWIYAKDGKTNDMSGEYSINDNGLLVLDSDESQMVAEVVLAEDREMKFTLAGGPPADPGLSFVRNP